MKCDKCLHTRLIISENGLHPICTLSPKAAMKCIFNNYDRFLTINEWDARPIEPILESLIRKELEETK